MLSAKKNLLKYKGTDWLKKIHHTHSKYKKTEVAKFTSHKISFKTKLEIKEGNFMIINGSIHQEVIINKYIRMQ